jgi:hypothetical protein
MWLNFLGLVPSTVLTLLLITIAFLRFYDQTDFEFLGLIAHTRQEKQRKIDEELRSKHEQRMKALRQENAKLAELESRLDAVLPKYNFSLTPQTETDGS